MASALSPGSDLLGGISIITSVLLGEYLAGSIIVLMLAGEEALERYAAGFAIWKRIDRLALKVSHDNKSAAAALLQIKRSTLGDRINRCGLGRVAAVDAQNQAIPAS